MNSKIYKAYAENVKPFRQDDSKNLITKILAKEEVVVYSFKDKDTGIAGICPDCGGIISFNSYFKRYQCKNKKCYFEANIKKERVWDNANREENIKTL